MQAEQPSSPFVQQRGSILRFTFVAVLWMRSHGSVSPCTEDPTSGRSTAAEASPAQSRGTGISSLPPLTAHLWMQLRIRSASWAGRAHCWFVSSSHPTSPMPYGAGLRSVLTSPQHVLVVGVPSPQLLPLPLDLCPLRFPPWMASRPSAVSHHPTARCR